MIGTGPYAFSHWTPKQKIVLERFAGYGGASSHYERKPQWDTIEFVPISDFNSAQLALEAGSLDWAILNTGSVASMQKNSNFRVYSRTTPNYAFINMKVRDPHLSNINLRKAIRYAVDVPSIIQAAYDGRWTRAYAIIPRSMGVGYWPGAPHYNRDVNKAKALLQAAGVSNLSLSLAVVDVDADKTVAQVVQQNLADIGITVNINVQDNATFNQIPGPGGGGKNRQLVYSHYVTEPDPSWSIVWFTCAQVDQWNWAEWCDKQFSNLYNQALRVQNPAKRTQIYIQMQKIWDANANTIWVGYPTDFYAGKKGLTPTLRPDGEVLAAWFRAT